MQSYEFTYLLDPDLSQEERKLLQESLKSFIQGKKGSLIHSTPPAKNELAYPIKKKQEAFLATLIFELEPENIANLEKKIRAEKGILRYLILKHEETRERKRARPRKKRVKRKTKVELKEIEKKLEEILGE